MSTTELTEPQLPESSTILDQGAQVDPAQHKEPEEKPLSRMDAIAKAEEELGPREEDKKEPEKDAPEPVKDEEKVAQPDDKIIEKEAKEPEKKPVEDKRYPEPPAKFLPRAKELWRNVPNEVKSEIDRLHKEHDAEIAQHKTANERYEAIRQYDELAKGNGRDLRDSLAKMTEIEGALQSNPIAGLNRILMEVGPRKADGQPLSLFEVAQFIVQAGPQGYQQMMAQSQQQQAPQPNKEVETLRQELDSMKMQMAAAQIIEPFAASHSRYYELQDDIAFFLNSGKIPQSLNPSDRLAAAYDMAVRINPSSHVEPDNDEGPANRVVEDLNGKKSVKGAPLSGVDTQSRRKGRLSRSEAIDAAMSELGLS